jgi:hypothetical protein
MELSLFCQVLSVDAFFGNVMITELRNKAFVRLGISFLLLLLTLTFIWLWKKEYSDLFLAVAIISGLFATIVYVHGNIELAQARGYDGAVVGATIIVACLCTGILFLAMPIILFSLKDKHRARRRSRS